MNNVFNQYLDRFMLVFLEDILIFSKNEEEHVEHVRMDLKVLRKQHLYAKRSKCDFYKNKIHYLGHIISDKRILVDPKEFESIMNWTTP